MEYRKRIELIERAKNEIDSGIECIDYTSLNIFSRKFLPQSF